LTVVFIGVALFYCVFFMMQKKSLSSQYSQPNKYLFVTSDKMLQLQEKQTECTPISVDSLPASSTLFFFTPLPVNSADRELLMTIKGIGPVLADTIINRRDKEGLILSVSDLQNIPGVGHKRALALASELIFDRVE
jgi:DNA uptake protein ComE-like DNA-binding protein